MDANTTCNVADLFGRDRESLEHLLGTSLSETQKVYIVAFTPGTVPDPATRALAADTIERILDDTAAHAHRCGVTEDEIDQVVDEAMGKLRRRNDT